MRNAALSCCLALVTAPALMYAQAPEAAKAPEPPKPVEAPAAHYYHLDFSIQELGADNKPTNTRAYSATISTETHTDSSIRVGSRVPIITGSYPDAGGDKRASIQYQYLDVGVNIYISHAHEIGRLLALDLKAEISTLAGATAADPAGPSDPVIRQNYWQSAVLIPVGKPTIVFTSDALENKGGMQVVVTVTELK